MSASAELMLDIAAVRRDARRNGPLLRICHALERHLTEAASLPEDSGPASAASPITGDAAAASSDEVLRDIIRRIWNGLQHNFGDRSDIQAICAELERRLGSDRHKGDACPRCAHRLQRDRRNHERHRARLRAGTRS